MGLSPRNVNYYFSTANYVSLNDKGVSEVESWNTGRIAVSVPVGHGGTASFDAGIKTVANFSEEEPNFNNNLAFEAKYKQNLTNNDKLNARAYLRWRNSEGSNQVRGAIGASYKIDKNFSIYADGHYTVSGICDGKDGVSQKYGGWVGASYKNLWAEGQYNNSGPSINVGWTYKF